MICPSKGKSSLTKGMREYDNTRNISHTKCDFLTQTVFIAIPFGLFMVLNNYISIAYFSNFVNDKRSLCWTPPIV